MQMHKYAIIMQIEGLEKSHQILGPFQGPLRKRFQVPRCLQEAWKADRKEKCTK